MNNIEKNNFGGWAIDLNCYEEIRNLLPENSTILEFGSGSGTAELIKNYTVYSIEHNKDWLNKYDTNYIHAPIKEYKENNHVYRWYDKDIIKKEIPASYDLILVDGPPSNVMPNGSSRMGFYYNLDLFNLKDSIIIFDDVNRNPDFNNMKMIADKLNRRYEIIKSKSKSNIKDFGILYK